MKSTEDHREPRSPFAALPRAETPPPALEDRVIQTLRARGLVRRRGFARWIVPLAASLVGLAGGWLLRGPAQAGTAPVADPQPLFLLLVSADPEVGPPMAERVEIYRDWAIGLAQEGRLDSARKLTGEGVFLDGESGPVQPLEWNRATPSGYFLVHAANLEEAVELARQSPHARLGGRVTVRAIDPV